MKTFFKIMGWSFLTLSAVCQILSWIYDFPYDNDLGTAGFVILLAGHFLELKEKVFELEQKSV